jgi:sugar phosphate permease
MKPASISEKPGGKSDLHPLFITAWLLCAVFYFVQYALRSAPGVMMPELSTAWGLNALGLSSLLGMYYYTYAIFAIVAGASLDRYGAKYSISAGVAVLRLKSADIHFVMNSGRRPVKLTDPLAKVEVRGSPTRAV